MLRMISGQEVLQFILNLLVTRINIIYAMDDGFHSFVCGDCWNLGDFACVEWEKTLYCATIALSPHILQVISPYYHSYHISP
jgi:hypothetical protein